jgi:hypothetical protein
MKKQQVAFILGGAWFAGMAVIASMSACSGDTGTGDSGTKDQTSPDTGNKDTGTPDQNNGDTAPPQDAGADCKTVPTGAPFTTDSGPFCPFQGDGSTFGACADGQHCCLPSTGNSTCAATCQFTNPDASNSDFQCNETNDCTTGQVCCENAGAQIQQDLGCTQYDFVSKQHGTTCVQTSCPAGQAQICGSTADCSGGKTCFPVNTKAMWLGVCVGPDGGT